MLQFLRLHWFDIGIFFSLPIGLYLFFYPQNELSLLLWISLVTLFIHQLEEYRYPGYFPGMMNSYMFESKQPDRYPLNTNTALIVNTIVGWLFFFLAAAFAKSLIWLGIATMLVSFGNFIVHTFVFNIKGKSKYNPGMASAIVLFLPLTVYFFYYLITNNLASPLDWIAGIIFGVILNVVGVIGLIIWLKDENTTYAFPKRSLLPSMRD